MDDAAEPTTDEGLSLAGETPALRMVSLLEFISTRDQIFTLQSLVVQTGLPKPTLHRMLQQLEGAGLLTRHSDGRHYGTGARLRRMAEDVLLNDSRQGARRMTLAQLAEEVGESCNLTAVSGNDVIYLDRVETSHPLRVHLEAGSRVPIHASASGKMIASQYGDTPRRRLLTSAQLRAFTSNTVTDPDVLDEELGSVRQVGYALDRQEYLEGLVCLAVLIPTDIGRSNQALAVQAPVIRKSIDDLVELLPVVRAAAKRMAVLNEIDRDDATASSA
ncbi:IclR family transcriptional regulator [Brevibacterium marinum]|uniref:DNA-binding IclR family transcriptional regulator n=1 Tax=Brevibacterium marinum TaxID=418643 RepID=A0A846S4M0_9MICO|nr:IclR family transcriptional regulator [Brevibacterium marinum]NJC57031.1 DNA-binding IclR family transcriptional regulator [Brevibacterium marinum]